MRPPGRWKQIYTIFLFILIVTLLVPTLSQEEDAFPRLNSRQPSACRPDDARCLALQTDVCDPWNITATDKCTFVQIDEHCKEDVNRINYLAIFYCHNKVAMIFAGLAWIIVLFYIMTYLASSMGMAPDIAGVTLFAFASGAPDLFTQVAALASGDHVDIELAVSATFGGGLFIICVVFSAVILAAGGDIEVPDRRSYIRDISAYMAATIATLILLWVGTLNTLDGVLLLAGYFIYLGICLKTRSKTVVGGSGANGVHAGEHQHQYVRAADHGALGDGGTGSGTGRTLAAVQGDDGLDDAELEMVPFTLEVVNDPGSPAGGEGGGDGYNKQRLQRLPSPRNRGGTASTSTAAAKSPNSKANLRPRSSPGPNGSPFVVETRPGEAPRPLFQSNDLPPPANSPLLPPGTSSSSAIVGGVSPTPPWTLQGVKEALKAWAQDLPETLEELLHLHGKTGFRRYFGYFTSPLVLFMHATMPAVNNNSYSMAYAAVLSVFAPPFFLLTANMGPSTPLGYGGFFTVWLSSGCVLLTFAFAIHPVGSTDGTMHSLFMPASPRTDLPGISSAVPGGLDMQQPLSPRNTILEGHRPRKCMFFALIAFLQCILWLNAAAEELVSIFEAIGRIWNVRRDILGATVLAWGETVPDLVAVVSLSKAGQGTMAVAACFGGPVFNLLVSMGGPILIAGLKTGSINYQMTSGVVILVISTVLVLLGLVALVPKRYNWRLQTELGWVLIGFYSVSQIVFLLAEGVVL